MNRHFFYDPKSMVLANRNAKDAYPTLGGPQQMSISVSR